VTQVAGVLISRPYFSYREFLIEVNTCPRGHAQKILSAPRKLLAAVPGLELIELKESEICCGSAGIYNVVHNDMAEKLLQNKMRRIEETKADLILTANPGCLLQLRAGVSRAGSERRVLHVIELLDEAYRGLTS